MKKDARRKKNLMVIANSGRLSTGILANSVAVSDTQTQENYRSLHPTQSLDNYLELSQTQGLCFHRWGYRHCQTVVLLPLPAPALSGVNLRRDLLLQILLQSHATG